MSSLFLFHLSPYSLHFGPAFGALAGLMGFWCFRCIKQEKIELTVSACLLWCYGGIVFSLTQVAVFPWHWDITVSSVCDSLAKVEYIPLAAAVRMYRNSLLAGSFREFIRLMGGNLLLLFPLGILQKIRLPGCSFMSSVKIGLAVSFSIEFLQFFMNCTGHALRAVEIDDILLNTAGCCLGWCMTTVLRGAKNIKTCKKRTGRVN